MTHACAIQYETNSSHCCETLNNRICILCSLVIRLLLLVALFAITLPAVLSSSSSSAAQPAAPVFDPVNWSNLTQQTLAAVDPSQFLTITATQLNSIPPNACPGFTISQLTNLGAPCSGFSTGCIAQIVQNQFSGIQPTCIGAMTNTTIQAITPNQISNLGNVCGGFTPIQASALQTPQCTSLPLSCVALFNVSSVAAFTLGCIQGLGNDQIASFNVSQIASISLTAVAGITSANAKHITSGCAGWTAQQFSAMSASPFYAWNLDCSRAFTPAGLGGWLRAQMRGYSPSKFWQWTVDQVAGLSPLGASGISPAAAAGIPAANCAGFHSSQIALFRDDFDRHVCQTWKGDCLAQIKAPEWVGFTQECMQKIQPASLSVISSSQMSHIAPTTFYSMTNLQIAAFTQGMCSGITGNQMKLFDAWFPANGCSALSTMCVNALSNDAVSQMSEQCYSHISMSILNNVSIPFFEALPASAWAGLSVASCAAGTANFYNNLPSTLVPNLSGDCIAAIPASVVSKLLLQFFAGLSVQGVSKWGATQCSALSSNQFNSLQIPVIAAVPDDCVSALTPAAVSGLFPSTISSMSSSQIKIFTATQCSSFSADTLASFSTIQAPATYPLALNMSADCLSGLSHSACAAMPIAFLDVLDVNQQVPALNSSCIHAFPCSVVNAMTPAMFNALNLPADDKAALTSNCGSTPAPDDNNYDPKTRNILLIVSLAVFGAAFLCLVCRWRADSSRREEEDHVGLNSLDSNLDMPPVSSYRKVDDM